MKIEHRNLPYFLIALLGAILFIPALGQVHLFDWDEINFAECAREMLVTKNYLLVQIDFQPFWEKPPLFIWMQALSMKLFGINEFAARFPNAIIGMMTLLTFYHVGRKVVNQQLAKWWVLLYIISWLPHFYFKSGIIDPTFNYFIFLAFYQVYLLRISSKKTRHALYAGLFFGLAVLTKGPVAALIGFLSWMVYIVMNRGLNGYKWVHILLLVLTAILPFGLWFVATVLQNGWPYGSWFIREFVDYQIRLFSTKDAGHGGPFLYHFIVLLMGCFPASIFFLQGVKSKGIQDKNTYDFTRWMNILFWVVLLLFSIVKTKIVHYSSLCYFPLTFLAALQVEALASQEFTMKKGLRILLAFIGILWALLLIALPIIGMYKGKLYPYIKDPFAVGNFQAQVNWSMLESCWGVILLIGMIIVVWNLKNNFRKSIGLLVCIQVVLIQITILHFTPKVEAFSQRAAIDYFKTFQGKEVYVQVLGYKSYAHLFYTQKKPPKNLNSYHTDWLLHGAVDLPTYFICKNIGAADYLKMPELEKIGEENGFVFFKRK